MVQQTSETEDEEEEGTEEVEEENKAPADELRFNSRGRQQEQQANDAAIKVPATGKAPAEALSFGGRKVAPPAIVPIGPANGDGRTNGNGVRRTWNRD